LVDFGLRVFVAVLTALLVAVFLVGLGAGNGNAGSLTGTSTGASTLYGAAVSAGLEPNSFLKNSSIINLLIQYLLSKLLQSLNFNNYVAVQ